MTEAVSSVTSVTFQTDEGVYGVAVPPQRPCTVIFPVPSDWTEQHPVYISTWAGGRAVEHLHPVAIRRGDVLDVTIGDAGRSCSYRVLRALTVTEQERHDGDPGVRG